MLSEKRIEGTYNGELVFCHTVQKIFPMLTNNFYDSLKTYSLILWKRMHGTEKGKDTETEKEILWASLIWLSAQLGHWWWLMSSRCSLMSFSWGRVAQFQFKVITKYISIFSLFNICPRWEIPRRAQSVLHKQQKQRYIYLPPLKRRIIFRCFPRASFRNILAASKWLPFKASHWELVPAFARKPFLFLFRARVSVSSLASCSNLPSMLTACLQYFV